MVGTFLSCKSASSSFSCSDGSLIALMTTTATSVLRRICLVFSTRSCPSSPSSSIPGVSMISTGPIGRSSMDFCTGSVVVPSTSDTTDSACPVTAFTRLDLPLFLLPKKPICTRCALLVSFSPIPVTPFCFYLYQNLKSRCPFSILTRFFSTISRTFSRGILASCSRISFSPFALVSGEA